MKTTASREGMASRRDFVDRVMAVLPGLKGYLHYTEQYTADREIRFSLADNISRVKKWLRSASFIFAERGSLGEVMSAERYDTMLEGMEKKVLSEDSGTHSTFSHLKVKLNSTKLDEILLLDSFISGLAEKMCDGVRLLDPLDPKCVKKAFDLIDDTIKLIDDSIIRRNKLTSGV